MQIVHAAQRVDPQTGLHKARGSLVDLVLPIVFASSTFPPVNELHTGMVITDLWVKILTHQIKLQWNAF